MAEEYWGNAHQNETEQTDLRGADGVSPPIASNYGLMPLAQNSDGRETREASKQGAGGAPQDRSVTYSTQKLPEQFQKQSLD